MDLSKKDTEHSGSVEVMRIVHGKKSRRILTLQVTGICIPIFNNKCTLNYFGVHGVPVVDLGLKRWH